MFFAIRDDDVNAWTTPEELSSLYAPLWKQNIPVSFAVIPFSVRSHHLGDVDRFYQEETERPLEDNRPLVNFLRTHMEQGLVEVLLHGYSHLYALRENGELKPANKAVSARLRQKKTGALPWIPEYRWKSSERLLNETLKGKAYLENLLDTEVRVFVPPSNTIDCAGARALDRHGLNLSGILQLHPDRPLSFSYGYAYLRRWAYRLLRGQLYPHAARVGKHHELVAYPLTPRASWKTLKAQFDHCQRVNAPFVLATHYWELLEYPELKKILYKLVDHARTQDVTPTSLSNLFPHVRSI